jgi:hypothetical protein
MTVRAHLIILHSPRQVIVRLSLVDTSIQVPVTKVASTRTRVPVQCLEASRSSHDWTSQCNIGKQAIDTIQVPSFLTYGTPDS